MTNGRRKAPRWTIAFLHALERTGEARAAATDAGIDHSTAYARRRAHADFAADWAAALVRFAEARDRARAEELGAVVEGIKNRPSPGSPPASPTSPASGRGDLGEDLVVSGGQLKRASGERWGRRKQEAFLAELAVTGNLRRASKAAGISYEAVRRRRRKDPRLVAACKAAIEACRARIPEFLAEAAAATFDPEALAESAGSELPKVTIDQAIKISQMGAGARASRREAWPDPFEEEETGPTAEDEAADIREHLIRKLRRLRDREMPDRIAEGWSFDEAWDQMVPPGWIRDPDYVPRGNEG